MLRLLAGLSRAMFSERRNLLLENIALRQQLVVLRRQVVRVRLKPRDRVFWAVLSRLWSRSRECLFLVQPATVRGWQRAGFRLFGRLKSCRASGRPRVLPEVQRLIREMSTANRLGVLHAYEPSWQSWASKSRCLRFRST